MTQQTYTFQLTSRQNSIVAYVLFILLLVGIAVYLPLDEGSRYALFILLFVALFISLKIAATATTAWTVSDEGIKIRWISQFLLHRNSDISVRWVDVQCVDFGGDRNFVKINLILRGAVTHTFYHSKFSSWGNFSEFKDDILKRQQLMNPASGGASVEEVLL